MGVGGIKAEGDAPRVGILVTWIASAAFLALPLATAGAGGGQGASDAGEQTEEPAESEEPIQDEITVYGFHETLETARAERFQAVNLKEVLAADAIGKLPDHNLAEALARVPAVYLRRYQDEGRYVSIRGVDPILNNVTLNGQTLAVSDTDGRSGRAAPLDVLSASSLSLIEVHKVTTPDMDGQSIGGTINVVTPSGFDGGRTTVRLEAGANDFGSASDIYSASIDHGATFGADDRWAVYLSASTWHKEILSHLYEVPRVGFPENAFTDVLVPERIRLGSAVGERRRTNVSVNLQHKPADGSLLWLRAYGTRYVDEELRPEFTLRNRGDVGATSPNEFYWTRYAVENETRHERQERPVLQIVLGGETLLAGDWQIAGDLNYTNAREENPFLNYYETESRSGRSDIDDPADAPVTFTLDRRGFATPRYNPDASGGLTPADPAFHAVSRLRNVTSRVEEDTFTATLDATRYRRWGDKTGTLQAGVKYLTRDKKVDDQDSRFPYDGSATLATLGGLFADVGQGEPYRPVPGLTLPVPLPGPYEQDRQANPDLYGFDEDGSASNSIEDDYTMDEDILALYAMASIDVTPELTILGGVRVEATDVEVSAFAFVDEIETELPPEVSRVDELPFEPSDVLSVVGTHDYVNVLPAVLVKWAFSEGWLLRGSVSTNIGRPDYPDTAPISTLTVSEDSLEPGVFSAFNEIGNPNLEPYEGINVDLTVDYYIPGNRGLFTAGVFYKRIENAIYEFRESLSDFEFAGVVFETYDSRSVSNAEPGHIAGIELAYQQDFRGLPAPWNGLGFAANVAWVDSEIEVQQRPGEKLPFFNQADLLYNVTLYYDRPRFSARAGLAYQSEAIFDEIRAAPADDIFRAESTRIDARVEFRLNDAYGVYLSGRNLTDEPDLTFRNGDERFIGQDPGYELYGREFRIGFSFKT